MGEDVTSQDGHLTLLHASVNLTQLAPIYSLSAEGEDATKDGTSILTPVSVNRNNSVKNSLQTWKK